MRFGAEQKVVDDVSSFFATETDNPLAEAFTGKLATHAGISRKPIMGDDADKAMLDIASTKRNKSTSVYISVPFCETKCLYCGFYNKAYRVDESKIFADALIKEIELWRDKDIVTSYPIQSVYFGGGTPTALEPEDISRIIATVKQLPLANDCEITMEGRLSNMTNPRVETYIKGGINRFSLGVQSFNTDIRRSMGRRSSQGQIIENVNLIKSYNEAAVVFDLIYGFPNQTMDIWEEDLRIAQELNVDGFDCYQLNVYGTTPLGKLIEEGKMPTAGDHYLKSAMFARSVEVLNNAFYTRLSMNHWARTTRERNIYNQFARGYADCIAFGPGAGGSLNGTSYMVQRDYKLWQDTVAEGKKPVMVVMPSSDNHKMDRIIASHIELGHINFDVLEKEFNLPLSEMCSEVLSQWEHVGLITRRGKNVVLTIAGQYWYVNLTQLLLECIKFILRR